MAHPASKSCVKRDISAHQKPFNPTFMLGEEPSFGPELRFGTEACMPLHSQPQSPAVSVADALGGSILMTASYCLVLVEACKIYPVPAEVVFILEWLFRVLVERPRGFLTGSKGECSHGAFDQQLELPRSIETD